MLEFLGDFFGLLKFIIMAIYVLIAYGVCLYFLFKIICYIHKYIKEFFDRSYYHDDSHSIPYALGPYLFVIISLGLGFLIFIFIYLVLVKLLGDFLLHILFLIGIYYLYHKFIKGHEN
ncbi:hypothetical protein [Staphylococcus sp. GDX8P80P]|uniref:hypothetical protein n=1 Tax=Staphylococcus sp. GDX8P80P TaxID=2804104 RepID=UPI001AEC20E1|nr:hypothetical protein [Staphylococcus sp. GDX8P80P]